ncbi:hypothetical protein QN360_18745 [Glaciimonas sp. CA11.2]|nr:hypothetical protein [Glaciimonas sp. CA11.2]
MIALAIQHSLAAARQRQIIAPDSQCCFCDEPLVFPGRFCDVESRDDFEKEYAEIVLSGNLFGSI